MRADAIVVGSGAGGAPVAAALAESGRDVLVLESGPRLETADFNGREGEMLTRLLTTHAVNRTNQSLFAGSCVGGSTVVNDALCFRPPRRLLEDWRGKGLRLEGFEDFVELAWREVHASPTGRENTNRNAHHLEVGARKLGWRVESIPRNVRGCANLGLCNFGCPSGAKQSTLVTWLPRAERAGARVQAGRRVDRVLLESGAVRGVEVAGERIEAPLVVLAAGVLGTPPILQASGIRAGPGFQAHSSLYVSARFAERVDGFYGPTMSMGVTEFAPDFMLENVAVQPLVTATSLPGFGADHERLLRALPYLARCVVVLRDQARGHVGSQGIDYRFAGADHEAMRRALLEAVRLYLAAGAEEVFLPLQAPHSVQSVEAARALLPELIDASRMASLYAVHLFGGAPMADDPQRGVCDEAGAVFATRGLYVSDASALPSNTGVNPQITILANALRVADGLTR